MSTIAVDNVRPSLGGTSTDLMSGLSKGWGSWDASGTPALDDSFNVASLVDEATGNFTLNWSNDMSAADYTVAGGAGAGDAANLEYWLHYPSSKVLAASLTTWVVSSGQIATDVAFNSMAVIGGDLA